MNKISVRQLFRLLAAADNWCVLPFYHLHISNYHFIGQFLAVVSSHQAIIKRPAVIRQSSDSHQTVIRQSSDSHQAVIRLSTGSCPVVIKQSSAVVSQSLLQPFRLKTFFSFVYLHNTRPRTVILLNFWTRKEHEITFESLPPLVLCTCA